MSARELAQGLYTLIMQHPDSTKAIVDGFLDFVQKKNLVSLLPAVVKHLEALAEQAQARDRLQVTFAQEHDNALVQEIAQFAHAAGAEIKVTTDAAIQGGFIAQYKNVVYDASVQNSLFKAKQLLLS